MGKISQIIIKIIILLIMLQPILITTSQANDYWSNILDTGNGFLEQGKDSNNEEPVIDQKAFKVEIEKLYNMLLIIGIILAVLIGAILGIKFMIGSIDEQAKIKELLIPYVVSCIIIFGAFGIWKLMIEIFANVSKF